MTYQRPTWDEYFVELMQVTGRRANCDRGRSGAVIVVDRRVVATGYVGAPAGCQTCDEVGHLMVTRYDERGGQHHHCVRTTHAEANAIAQAARYGTSIAGGTLYTKMTPCLDCCKLAINVGIVRVVALRHYHAEHDSLAMFAAAGVNVEWIEDAEEQYETMREDQCKSNPT